MEEVTLVAELGRETGKSVARAVRRAGKVPAVVYGLSTESQSISVGARELGHILSSPGGANTLINLDMGDKKELVLARQIVRHPVKHTITHVDLIRVSRDTAVSAEVPLHLVGEAEGVREGGIVEQVLFGLAIEAKPADLPNVIEVDVTALSIGDHLSVADLTLPRGVTATVEPETQVVHVSQPRGLALPEEEEAAAAEAEAEAAAEAGEGGEGGEAGGGGESGERSEG
jgi:large subunit ribosomal protein L25